MIAPALLQERKKPKLDLSDNPRQSLAWRTLHDPAVDEVLYGGAKGGGKTHLGVWWVFLQTLDIIKDFGLKRSVNPPSVGFMGRAQSTLFTKTTLETWRAKIPVEYWRIREQAKQIVIADAAAIDFGGMDVQETIQKFNSAENAFAFIDQAEEVSRNNVAALRASLRIRINERFPSYKILYTANPGPVWLYDEFILNPEPGQRYIPALPTDNPYLPPNYIRDRIEQPWKHRPELIQAYRDGRWDVFGGITQIIHQADVAEAANRQRYPAIRHKLIACDVARFGDDETVIYVMDETQIRHELIYGKKDLMHTANNLQILWRKYDAEMVAVDVIGIGAGVVDRLQEMGVPVMGINSAEASGEPEDYANLRAEIWDKAGRMFSDGDVALQWSDKELRSQLCAPTYKFRGGKMLIEEKEEIKKRLDRSPDKADAYVMGLHALRHLRREHMKRPSPGVVIYEPTKKEQPIPERSYAGRRKAWEEKRRLATADTW